MGLDMELLHFSLRVVPALNPKLFDLGRYHKGIFLGALSHFLLANEPPIPNLLAPILFRVDIGGLGEFPDLLSRLLTYSPIRVSFLECMRTVILCCVNFGRLSPFSLWLARTSSHV